MGRAIVILSVFLMVMGCGGVASSTLKLLPSAYAGEEGGAEKPAADPNAPHPDFEYVQMDPLLLPVITTKGLTQQVSVMVQLEVDWGTKDDIVPFKPRLTDAYLQDLYGELGAGHGMMKDNFVDVALVKQRLTSVTDKVLGPDHKVHGVLLQVLQQRPL